MGSSGRATPGIAGSAVRFGAAAAVGGLVVWPCAAIVRGSGGPRAQDAMPFLVPLIVLIGFVVPLGTWLALAALRVRPAAVVACCGYLLSIVLALAAEALTRGRAAGPAWLYGLCAALAYGLSALVCDVNQSSNV